MIRALPRTIVTAGLMLACMIALPTVAAAANGHDIGDWDTDRLAVPAALAAACVSDEFAGVQLASGDVDGDGFEDLVTACARTTSGGVADAGVAFVWLRRADTGGFHAARSVPLAGLEAGARCGAAVGIVRHHAGAQVAIGCPGATVAGAARAGKVQLFDVTKPAITHAGDLTAPVPAADLGCGHAIDVARIDADTQDDLAVACYHDAQTSPVVPRARGAALVFTRHASDAGFDRERLAPTTVQETNPGCGHAIAAVERPTGAAGRHADIVLGCPWDSFTDASSVFHWEVGTLLVYRRGAANDGFEPELRIAETATTNGGSNCGWSIAAFDVTSADYGLASGCRHATVSGAWGAGAVVAFTPAGTGWTAHPRLEVGTADIVDGGCGFSLAPGDFDGDGRDDLLVGCPSARNGSPDWGKGIVGVFHGSAGPAPFVEAPAVRPTVRAFPMVCGASLAIGDPNADGRSDILTGCAGATTAAYANGFLLPVLRADDGASFDPASLELTGSSVAADTRCGSSVALLAGVAGRPPLLVGTCNDGLLLSSAVTRRIAPASTSKEFAPTVAGTSSEPLVVRIDNTGTGRVHTTTPSLAGDVDAFTIIESACTNIVLAAGASCEIRVAFLPRATGSARARLVLGTTDGGTITVQLRGDTPSVVATPRPDGDTVTTTTPVVQVLPTPRAPVVAGRMRITGSLWLDRREARRLGLRLPKRGPVFVGSVVRSQSLRRSGSLIEVRVTARLRAALSRQSRRDIPATLRLRVTSGHGKVLDLRRQVRLKARSARR